MIGALRQIVRDRMEKIIVFDFGGTKVKHALVNTNGEIVTKSTYETETENLNIFLDNLFLAIRTYVSSHEIRGIAISMPGYIDVNTGYSERAGAITALNKMNIKQLVENEFSLPVEVENDGNCAALAEKINGNAQGCENFICMTIGTGIGGCIYLNGDIHRGYRLRAGEFGMMITYLADGQKKDMHQTAGFPNLIKEYKNYKNINRDVEGTEIFTEALTDPMVKDMIDCWIGHISRGIYNLAVTLNPEKILIGGGVSVQPYLIAEINRQLTEFQYWDEFTIPVVRCKFQNDAGMMGAFYHFNKMQGAKNKILFE